MKHIHGTILAIILTSLPITSAHAAINDGKELLSICSDVPDSATTTVYDAQIAGNTGKCTGWVESALVFMYSYGSTLPAINACFPVRDNGQTIAPHQGIRILVKHLNDHPERLHEPPMLLTLDAMKAAFPCE